MAGTSPAMTNFGYNGFMNPGTHAGWALDPTLARDTRSIGDLPLCRVLLSRDANYPWLLLVPRRRGAVELIDLDPADQAPLTSEIADASRALKALTGCDKLNVAAIGNVVAQLHIHVIARFHADAAWPKPVWNAVPPREYQGATAEGLIAALRKDLALTPI
jgi:diadenosine tetraphosphate (Ap4A) HIT family hydrolase